MKQPNPNAEKEAVIQTLNSSRIFRNREIKITQYRDSAYRLVVSENGEQREGIARVADGELEWTLRGGETGTVKLKTDGTHKTASVPNVLESGVKVGIHLYINELKYVIEVQDEEDVDTIRQNITSKEYSYRVATRLEVETEEASANALGKKDKKKVKVETKAQPAEGVAEKMCKKYNQKQRKRMIIIYNSKTEEFRQESYEKNFVDMNPGIRTMQYQRVKASLMDGEVICNEEQIFEKKK